MAGEHFLRVAFASHQRRHVHAVLSFHSMHIGHLRCAWDPSRGAGAEDRSCPVPWGVQTVKKRTFNDGTKMRKEREKGFLRGDAEWGIRSPVWERGQAQVLSADTGLCPLRLLSPEASLSLG